MAGHQHASDSLSHTVRNSLVDPEYTFELGEAVLHCRTGNKERLVPYAEIGSVALISYPSFAGDQYQCTIGRRRGRKIKIRSHHYEALNVFEDRSHTYAPFISGLCRRVAGANNNARFISGSTGMWLAYLLLVVLMTCVGIVLAMAVFEKDFPAPGIAGALIAMLILGPAIWRMMRRGKGRSFDPLNPPASMMGR